MKSDVLAVALWWLLPTIWAGVLRDTEDEPCRSYSLNNLIYLDCSDRELTELSENLNYDAQVLLLSNNNFESFPSQLEMFSHAEKIDLSGNRLSRPLPTFLLNMPHLQTLNLSDNNYEIWISEMPNSNLEYLDLSKNKITQIHDDSFKEMTGLHHLDLSENRIADLQSTLFSGATNLLTLSLSRNSFTNVPSFKSTSLRSLHLSNCLIDNLNVDSLTKMTTLLEIDLSLNQIESVPDNFQSHTLQKLDLSYNEISSLTDRTFSALPNLAVLDLRGNEFKKVWSSAYFSSNPYLREIYVKGNRWSCEGFGVNLLLTYEYLTREPSKVVDPASSLICYSPSNVTQLTWQRAYIETWHRDGTADESYMFMAVMVGVIIGVLITSIICRGLMSLSKPEPPRPPPTETSALNGIGVTPQPRVEALVMRVPLHDEDLPPSYDEALLMPRLNSSFHSLPDFVDQVEEPIEHRHRRSRSIGDLTESRPRMSDRRSVRHTVQIRIN
ncbi:leucine-rich repeats and immunoglobulin-like domains protein 3 [Cydia strobilella]|uniref:leucine-rich repeats and immunoglobulin-like domains protein 3 n=1 Tax=Cydia strobilella TaxID=1100964 RepID=UPI003003AAE8